MNARLFSLPGMRPNLRVLILVTLLLGANSVGGSATSCIEYDTYGRELVDDRCVAAGEEAADWPDFDSTALGDQVLKIELTKVAAAEEASGWPSLDSTALGDQVLKIELAKAAAAEEASLWPDHNPNNPEQTQQIAQVAPGNDDDAPVGRGSVDPTLVGSDAEREFVFVEGAEVAGLVGSDTEREQVARPTDQEVIHTSGIAPR